MPILNNVTTATITLYKIEEVSLYQAEIISTNGNIFHPYDIHTTLNFRVYLNSEEITDRFTDIEWVKYSHDKDLVIEDMGWGKLYHGEKNINITRDDIDKKCIIQANAYTEINNIKTCVASARITLIDINELYSHTEPPIDPVDGSLWVNTKYNPPVIYSWNEVLNKWIEVGKTTPSVRNLIHNSNFWMLNNEKFLVDNNESLQPTHIEQIDDKNWITLKSKYATSENISAGIYQTTIYPIVKNSDYNFSFLIRKPNSPLYDGDNVLCKIFSLNENKEIKLIKSASIEFDSDKNVQISIPFQTFNDTEYIRCFVGIQPEKLCEYYITQLSLYNTKNYYPWELAPEDIQLQLENKLNNDHVSVFNALTKDGTMEGIYKRTDENGNEHYYFNASHIKTGTLDGGLINGIGLNIKDDVTGESIFHVYKNETGTHIDLIADNLLIGNSRESASTINYVNASMISAVNTAESYTNGQITEVNKVVVTKADSDTVMGIEKRVVDLELNTEEDAIVGTVTNSNIYVQMLEQNQQKFIAQDAAIANLAKDLSELETDIESNIKVNLTTRKIVSAVRDSNEYKEDLNKKLDVSSFESYVTNTSSYLETNFETIDDKINQKADKNTVTSISNKVTALENSTKASTIISVVRDSTEYKKDQDKKLNASTFNDYKTSVNDVLLDINESLDNKIESNEIITAINNTSETEKIDKSKIDLDFDFNLKTLYTSNGIISDDAAQTSTKIKIDNIIDNIEFDVNGTDLTMNVYAIKDTNYIAAFDNDANTYINTNEIIKLLLYEIKKLKEEINK